MSCRKEISLEEVQTHYGVVHLSNVDTPGGTVDECKRRLSSDKIPVD